MNIYMASLSLREGLEERVLFSNLTHSLIGDTFEGFLAREENSGYIINYAYNSHEVYWLNGNRIHLRPGESLFLNLNFNHSLRTEASRISKGLCLYYPEQELELLHRALRQEQALDYSISALRKTPEIRFEKRSHLNEKLRGISRDLEEDRQKLNAKGFESILEELLMEIDWELLGFNDRLSEYSPATRQALVKKVVQARKFMRKNLHLPLRLEEIANQVSMSPFHFQRQYKKATGISPARTLTEWRIQLAKKYLTQERYSILEVSTILSYSDLPTFSKAFKRETGYSPMKWKSIEKNKA